MKKLVLKKEVVSVLAGNEMNQVKGGSVGCVFQTDQDPFLCYTVEPGDTCDCPDIPHTILETCFVGCPL